LYQQIMWTNEDLYYVPFQVFQHPSDRTHLGERFRLSYAPSVTIFSVLRKAENVAGGKLLVVADPKISKAWVPMCLPPSSRA